MKSIKIQLPEFASSSRKAAPPEILKGSMPSNNTNMCEMESIGAKLRNSRWRPRVNLKLGFFSKPLSNKGPISMEVTPEYLREKSQLECATLTALDISNKTAPGTCIRLTLDDGSRTVIVKQTTEARLGMSRMLGLAREALFYSRFCVESQESMGSILPRVYFSQGDMATGEKRTIMEDLGDGWIDSGILFGPGNPNNWERDLATLAKQAGDPVPTAAHVASVSFRAYAKLHATYWGKGESVLNVDFLRGSDWLLGQGQESFEGSQSLAKGMWAKRSKSLTIDPLIEATIEAAIAAISFESQKQRLNPSTAHTLVHGDCWPGNVMYHGASDSVKLVDFEMVGVGSGPQELAQYLISNMEPAVRRKCESTLIREYYDELLLNGVINYSWEECWREYQIGGVGRWLWFLCYFSSSNMTGYFDFFQAQVLAFMQDHKLQPEDIGQLRP